MNQRPGKPNGKRTPLTAVEQVLGFYRYFDLNVWHVYQKLLEEQGIELSYIPVRLALQDAGLVAKAASVACIRKQREERLCRACCCTLTAANTGGFRTSDGMTRV